MGDMFCDSRDTKCEPRKKRQTKVGIICNYNYGTCQARACTSCEGCKDFRCSITKNCTVIKKFGENTTTCTSLSCKTNEDCKKLNDEREGEREGDDWVCNEGSGLCIANCKSCEGCNKQKCRATKKCKWDNSDGKCYEECKMDKDCIGRKFDHNNEVSEEGDMFCDSRDTKCEPRKKRQTKVGIICN